MRPNGYSSGSAGSASSHDRKSRWPTQPLPIRTAKMAADIAEDDASGSPPPVSGSSKRKRQDFETGLELEVDVEALEPPSKKALRKAKKSKTSLASATPTEQSTVEAPTTDNVALSQPEEIPSKSKTGTPRSKAIAATTFYDKGYIIDKVFKARSEWSIWIGNLPHNKTSDQLRIFLLSEQDGNHGYARHAITRIYMPGPKPNSLSQPLIRNDGWAYVDFDNKDEYVRVLGMSEKLFSGRKVLIKDAKCYIGRPAKPQELGKPISASGHPPSKRIFIGNLSFHTTESDVREHFSQCGNLKDVKLATFQDSGKCKGYGWVEFETIEAAQQAVQGWIAIKQEPDVNYNNDGPNHFAEATRRKAESRAQRIKPRRLFLNKLNGQEIRMEFAEDNKERYKKRFGKNDSKKTVKPAHGKKAGTQGKKVDARTIKPGAAHAAAPRLQGSIVAGQGKKTSLS